MFNIDAVDFVWSNKYWLMHVRMKKMNWVSREWNEKRRIVCIKTKGRIHYWLKGVRCIIEKNIHSGRAAGQQTSTPVRCLSHLVHGERSDRCDLFWKDLYHWLVRGTSFIRLKSRAVLAYHTQCVPPLLSSNNRICLASLSEIHDICAPSSKPYLSICMINRWTKQEEIGFFNNTPGCLFSVVE